MSSREIAQWFAAAAKLLWAASLYFVLIWWWVSAGLCLAGTAVFAAGRLVSEFDRMSRHPVSSAG